MATIYTPKEMLEKLVSFPTVSRNSNLDLIDFVEEYLAEHGVAATRVYNDDGDKANLYAHIGPDVSGGVILSGHTDVVPVDGQEWDTDPFTVTEKGGRLYGRGTCDMKGFDALVLAHVPQMKAAGLKRPIQIALSYDEEVGCVGAPRMIDEMTTLPKASAVIVGEPSMMRTVVGHKGSIGLKTHVRGHEVHSSLYHEGVSAVMVAGRLIEWLRQQTEANLVNAQQAEGSDALFTPPCTTLHVGIVEGGTAGNIVAKDCWFTTDIRCVPSEDPNDWRARYEAFAREVEADMRARVPDTEINIMGGYGIPPLKPEDNGAAEALVRGITGDNAVNVVSYGTEGGQFQERGFSAVICGPGDIAQAHQPNEYLEIDQLNKGAAFLDKLIQDCSK